MKTNYQSYYCYIDEGKLVIEENRPHNFDELPNRYVANCPNPEIAKMTYKSNLKIEEWRSLRPGILNSNKPSIPNRLSFAS